MERHSTLPGLRSEQPSGMGGAGGAAGAPGSPQSRPPGSEEHLESTVTSPTRETDRFLGHSDIHVGSFSEQRLAQLTGNSVTEEVALTRLLRSGPQVLCFFTPRSRTSFIMITLPPPESPDISVRDKRHNSCPGDTLGGTAVTGSTQTSASERRGVSRAAALPARRRAQERTPAPPRTAAPALSDPAHAGTQVSGSCRGSVGTDPPWVPPSLRHHQLGSTESRERAALLEASRAPDKPHKAMSSNFQVPVIVPPRRAAVGGHSAC